MSRPRKPVAHGTVPGYTQHQRRKEQACKECKAAWAAYYRDRRDRPASKNTETTA